MNTHDNTPIWRALGFEQQFMDDLARNEAAVLDLWWDGPPSTSGDDVESWAFSATSDGMRVFATGWMGYVMPHPQLNDWREAGRRAVSAAVYYFHGAWRDKFTWLREEYDRERSRAVLPWSNAYRKGLALALAFSDWTATDRLLEWPGPDLRRDEGTDDRTSEDNAYQIWLASRLRGEPEDVAATQREKAQREQPRRSKEELAAAKALRKVKKLLPGADAIYNAVVQREMIEQGARRRPKMLMAAADALLAGNAEEMAKALKTYLKHYRQQELTPKRADFGICLDATALWHLARRRGMGEIPLPEDLMVLIPRP